VSGWAVTAVLGFMLLIAIVSGHRDSVSECRIYALEEGIETRARLTTLGTRCDQLDGTEWIKIEGGWY